MMKRLIVLVRCRISRRGKDAVRLTMPGRSIMMCRRVRDALRIAWRISRVVAKETPSWRQRLKAFATRFGWPKLDSDQEFICRRMGVTARAYRLRALNGVTLVDKTGLEGRPSQRGVLLREEKPRVWKLGDQWVITVPYETGFRCPDGRPGGVADFEVLAPSFEAAMAYARTVAETKLAQV